MNIAFLKEIITLLLDKEQNIYCINSKGIKKNTYEKINKYITLHCYFCL